MIVTLTLNPALDVSTNTPKVRDTNKLRCAAPSLNTGGGGINVARLIHALGGAVKAIYPQGGPTGATFTKLLEAQSVPLTAVPIAGMMRESFTVDETESDLQYRFVMPGPPLKETELQALLSAIETTQNCTHIILSGSFPPECDPAIIHRLVELAKVKDAKLVVDTSGPALAACEAQNVYLLKPSLREVEELIGEQLESEEQQIKAASALYAREFAEIIIISLGERGAVLVNKDTAVHLPAIEVPAESAVGAGDSMVAAVTLALANGWSAEEALRYGIAAGAATLMTPATELARPQDIEQLYAANS